MLRGAVEIRLIRVDPAPDADAGHGPFRLRVGGFALADATSPQVTIDGPTSLVRRPDGLSSAVTGLRGLPTATAHRSTGGNAFGEHAAVPMVETQQPVEFGKVYAAAVVLSGTPVPAAALPAVEVDVDDRHQAGETMVRVCWPDAQVDIVVITGCR